MSYIVDEKIRASDKDLPVQLELGIMIAIIWINCMKESILKRKDSKKTKS